MNYHTWFLRKIYIIDMYDFGLKSLTLIMNKHFSKKLSFSRVTIHKSLGFLWCKKSGLQNNNVNNSASPFHVCLD